MYSFYFVSRPMPTPKARDHIHVYPWTLKRMPVERMTSPFPIRRDLWDMRRLLETKLKKPNKQSQHRTPCSVCGNQAAGESVWQVSLAARSSYMPLLFCLPDVDECLSQQHNCSRGTTCINTGGGFQCVNPECPRSHGNISYVKTSPL